MMPFLIWLDYMLARARAVWSTYVAAVVSEAKRGQP